MAKVTASYYQLNRGLVSRLALARMDIKRTAMSASLQTNFMPRVLGSMMLRPGLQYIDNSRDNLRAKYLEFVFSTDDVCLVEVTDGAFRIVNSAPGGNFLLERPTVTTTIVNPDFTTDLSGWTASMGVTWVTPDYAQFVGNGTTDETLDQTVTVAGANIGVTHALRIEIARGPVKIRVGTMPGLDDLVSEATLNTGTHSLAFTPFVDFTIRFFSPLLREVWLDSCNIEAGGVLEMPAPWIEDDLYSIRYDQSGDVLFVACSGNDGDNYQQRRIERRDNNSWSIVLYQTIDGPYRTENTGPITITPSASTGNITLTASADLFTDEQIGALYSITQQGQFVSASISSDNTFTDPIEVVGVDEQRRYAFVIDGVWMGTVTLQRSVGVVGNWIDVNAYTSNTTGSDKDGLDNQTVYYRLGIKTGDYASGTALVSLTYNLGSIRGVARITDFTSSTSVGAEVLKTLGANLLASDIWSEGSWSDRRGWPTSVNFYEGRLWWSGKNGIYGSVSDAFDDYSPDVDGTAGAAGTINRTIGSGPVDDINWLLGLQRLIIGAEGTEFSARSTAFDEPLTPTNFNIKGATTQGSANVNPLKIDSRGVFVQRAGTRVYELAYSGETNDYGVTDMTAIVPEIGEPSILTLGVQRQPDTRVHCIRSDGVAAVAVMDHTENVLSWQLVETSEGEIEDVAVLPGLVEDQVFYSVKMTIPDQLIGVTIGNGGTWPVTGVGQNSTLTIAGQLDIGSGAAAVVTGAGITGFTPIAGVGYTAGDVVTAVGGTFTVPAQVVLDTVDGSGAVTGFHISVVGVYSEPFGAGTSCTGGTGSGFAFANIYGATISEITVTHGGSGYILGADVTAHSGFGDIGAVLVAIVSSGVYRHLVKWAQESQCVGGTLNRQADSFSTFHYSVPTNEVTGLDYLEGFALVAWGDGTDLSPGPTRDTTQTTYTVASGKITLDVEVTDVVVGLPYTAQWRSTKLASMATEGASWLNQRKEVSQLGLIMADVHSQGVRYGPDFDSLDPLPKIENGTTVPYDRVWDEFDFDMMEFAGGWNTDSRICLECSAPRPCTVLAITMAVEEHGKG